MKVNIVVTDENTGKDVLIALSMHNAQKLYKSLREIVGDIQYQAQPGELVTMPDARIKV